MLSTPSATAISAFSLSQSFRLVGESKSSSTLPLTTTPKLWFAESPPGSLAVTVTVAVPSSGRGHRHIRARRGDLGDVPPARLRRVRERVAVRIAEVRRRVDRHALPPDRAPDPEWTRPPSAEPGVGGGGGGCGVGAVDPSPPQESVPPNITTPSNRPGRLVSGPSDTNLASHIIVLAIMPPCSWRTPPGFGRSTASPQIRANLLSGTNVQEEHRRIPDGYAVR